MKEEDLGTSSRGVCRIDRSGGGAWGSGVCMCSVSWLLLKYMDGVIRA